MTPKQKAGELVCDFYAIQRNEYDYGINWEMAKQCALIAVDELIKQERRTDDYYEIGSYWREVKKEIELL